MDYSFYFDETFHDRKITIGSNGKINTFQPDANDSYIGLFWGCEKYRLPAVVAKLAEVEAKYIQRFGLSEGQELKSTSINKKHFRKGVKTFVPNTFDFYYDFFHVLADYNVILHINMLSKIEYLLRNIFSDIKVQCPEINEKTFFYSMTKFMIFCHTPELNGALYNAAESGDGEVFKDELLRHFNAVIKADKDIVRKVSELERYRELKRDLRNYKFRSKIELKYDFIYEQNFLGLTRLLAEKNIPTKKVFLTIDREEKTAEAAKAFKFKRIEQAESTSNIQVRIADHLCGFFGRMIFALSNDSCISEDPIYSIEDIGKGERYKEKHLLDEKWFDINEKQLELYHLIYTVFIEKQLGAYWANMTWSYGDQAAMFYSLLGYFAGYDNIGQYKKTGLEMHSEYYNGLCCKDLLRHFQKMN